MTKPDFCKRCPVGGTFREADQTCSVPDPDDGLPLLCVGPWAEEKHARIEKYVDISCAVRKKFINGKGGAAADAASAVTVAANAPHDGVLADLCNVFLFAGLATATVQSVRFAPLPGTRRLQRTFSVSPRASRLPGLPGHGPCFSWS